MSDEMTPEERFELDCQSCSACTKTAGIKAFTSLEDLCDHTCDCHMHKVLSFSKDCQTEVISNVKVAFSEKAFDEEDKEQDIDTNVPFFSPMCSGTAFRMAAYLQDLVDGTTAGDEDWEEAKETAESQWMKDGYPEMLDALSKTKTILIGLPTEHRFDRSWLTLFDFTKSSDYNSQDSFALYSQVLGEAVMGRQ
ncbi:hypothetical protein BD324DRAFT_652182 [Kockovaella imperatae]|uniref:Uncharacterized protein n=1 Tax=Kockovaella imperatae TaxID=4999 RepID=A0A1Y1UC70_9TREE|nr:hypothetical protein BD324DRAFT_652182 [Kockovaella imperatae]ORX35633.1 hypothetical protein BD324DRAFT_652182 [Kockovaella imperatae]